MRQELTAKRVDSSKIEELEEEKRRLEERMGELEEQFAHQERLLRIYVDDDRPDAQMLSFLDSRSRLG
jgi:hypothetical protein